MKNILLLTAFSATLVFAGCGDEKDADQNDDKVETKDISHNGSIETLLSTEHIDSLTDVLITTHKIWKNGVIDREVRHVDTLQSLGTGTTEAADAQGNTKQVIGKKDYEFYITVK